MSTSENKRLAGMGLPTAENNPILQRQKEFGSKGESSGMTFKKPFANLEVQEAEKPASPTQSEASFAPPTEAQKTATIPEARATIQSQSHQGSLAHPMSANLTDEQILALAKERGLELQPKKIKYIKHTYSVTEYNHDMIPKISNATGITIQELMKEGMDYIVSKYYASYEYSLKAPTPKKRQ